MTVFHFNAIGKRSSRAHQRFRQGGEKRVVDRFVERA
jgi:hypothetical protein